MDMDPEPLPGGVLDVRSPYSHLRVRDLDDERAMYFVLADGEEVHEGRIELFRSHRLVGRYARSMMAVHLFVPRPERALLVGLGPGALVHHLRHRHPRLRLDAVEIDPAVKDIAVRYFGVREDERTRLIVEDGVEYLGRGDTSYDWILIDAFLPPSASTDENGLPLAVASRPFHENVARRLARDGAAVLNHADDDGHHESRALLAAGFGGGYRFPVTGLANEALVVTRDRPPPADELVRRGEALDADAPDAAFSFAELARSARPWR